MPRNEEVKLTFRVEGQNIAVLDQAGNKLGHVRRSMDELNTAAHRGTAQMKRLAMGVAGTVAAYVSLRAAVRGVREVIRAAEEQEQAVTLLNAALRTANQFSQQYSQTLQQQAASLQRLTAIGDETIISVQRQLIAFGATRENIGRTTQAVLDLSAGLGTDLQAAAVLVGKALGGSYETLSRYGILIDDTVPKSEKLEAALRGIEQRFGGQAQAAAATFRGRVHGVGLAFGDLAEQVGFALTKSDAATDSLRGLQERIEGVTDDVGHWVDANRGLIDQNLATVLNGIGAAAEGVGAGFKTINIYLHRITEDLRAISEDKNLFDLVQILAGVALGGVAGGALGGRLGLVLGAGAGGLLQAERLRQAGLLAVPATAQSAGMTGAGAMSVAVPFAGSGAMPAGAVRVEAERTAAAVKSGAEATEKLTTGFKKATHEAHGLRREVEETKGVVLDLGATLNTSIQRAIDAALTGGRGPKLQDVATAMVGDFIGGLLQAELAKRTFDQKVTENFAVRLPAAVGEGAAKMSDAWSHAMSTMGTVTTHATAGLGASFDEVFGDIASGASRVASAVGGSLRNVPGLGNLANISALFGGGGTQLSLTQPQRLAAAGFSQAEIEQLQQGVFAKPQGIGAGGTLAIGGTVLGLQVLQASRGGFTEGEIGQVAGSAFGMAVGAALGGPPGAIIGAAIGSSAGSAIADFLTPAKAAGTLAFEQVDQVLKSIGLTGPWEGRSFVPASIASDPTFLQLLDVFAQIGLSTGLGKGKANPAFLTSPPLQAVGNMLLAPEDARNVASQMIRAVAGPSLEGALLRWRSQRAAGAVEVARSAAAGVPMTPVVPGHPEFGTQWGQAFIQSLRAQLAPTDADIQQVASLVDVYAGLPDTIDTARLAAMAFGDDGTFSVQKLLDAINDTKQALVSIEQFRGTASSLRQEAENARFSVLGRRQQRAQRLGRLSEIDAQIAALEATPGGIDTADELKQANELLNERAQIGRWFVGIGGRKNVSIGASILEDTANTFDTIADLTEQELDGLATNTTATSDNTAAIRDNTAALRAGNSGGGAAQLTFDTTVNVENSFAELNELIVRTVGPALLVALRDDPRVRAAIRQVQVR